jgi:nitrogen regulatory protein PII
MKMVMIVYNEAIDSEVMEMLEKCGQKNYTKITGAFGRGTTSGIHLGNDIWPGRNNILYVACEDKAARQILVCANELHNRVGKEGIKTFILSLGDTQINS